MLVIQIRTALLTIMTIVNLYIIPTSLILTVIELETFATIAHGCSTIIS
ncbi:hypothetical protein GBAR_LOCUS18869 [Geodia barretti]|uniref:Uncharacterized protein n=1 Tax=Geodia barretti TaxID=519541 RepID=A0AA35SPY2_GEOBA|nr:hypothetical protein GBAR_LOCUS18869 [Geodia barretti]